MPASMQDIQKHIESVTITKQIAQAMKLVATTKIRRAQDAVKYCRPYAQESKTLMQSVVDAQDTFRGRLFDPAPDGITLFIMVGSDGGLCGPYNINVCKTAHELIRQEENAAVLTIGTKPYEYFIRRGVTIQKSYRGISQNPFYMDGATIGEYVLDLYFSGVVSKVFIGYNYFQSMLSHIPTIFPLLPLARSQEFNPAVAAGSFDEDFLESLLPDYVQTCIFHAMVEGAACEQSARITSMDSAVKNCSDMMDRLQMQFNQVRQSAITQELSEIVSGAEALQ